jgi:hypothetical protein
MLPVALVSTLAHTVARMMQITTITPSERGLSGRECPAQLSKIRRAAEPGLRDRVKRIRPEGDYAACRRVISARVARPVSVSEYGASNS